MALCEKPPLQAGVSSGAGRQELPPFLAFAAEEFTCYEVTDCGLDSQKHLIDFQANGACGLKLL